MEYSEEERVSDLATQLALVELVRIVIGEICHTDSIDHTKARLAAVELAAVDGLSGRRVFPEADEATESAIKERAASMITKIMTSIRHPMDDPGHD